MAVSREQELALLYLRIETMEKELKASEQLIALLKENNSLMEQYIEKLTSELKQMKKSRRDR